VAQAVELLEGGAGVGKRGRRSVHAFDLDGNVLWQLRQSDAPHPGHWPGDLANAPFASGNRLFIRTFNALYCLGDKAQPFTPRQAPEEGRP
jgi:hypothetical protein